MNRYTVEYNNKKYVIEGDKAPTESDMANLTKSQNRASGTITERPESGIEKLERGRTT